MSDYSYDVVVVGASIAGCTAACLFGRAGLRVALLEKQPKITAYKKLCTHFIQPSAVPTMDRLGVSTRIEAAGGIRTSSAWWIPYGDNWIRSPGDHKYPEYGYNIRREKLDPMMRELAAETPNVDLFLGHTMRDLVSEAGWYTGVVAAEQAAKEIHTFYGRLLVAADGHYSKMAELSGVKTQRWPNGRFGYYAYFKNLPLQTDNIAQVWFFDPDVVYAFPCDDDITLMTVMPTLDQLTEFKQDIEGNFLARLQDLSDGPDIAKGERISPILGMLKGEFHYRKAIVPGIAFIGDAAASTDPLWGCGCGWAFQSAEWLVDSMSHALLSGNPHEYGKSFGAYEWKHRHYLQGHNLYNASFANGRKFWPHERFVFTAATRNEACARHLHRYGARHIGILRLYSPINFARSVWVNTFA